MFWIGFTKEALPFAEPDEEGVVGLLLLGSHEEAFVAHTYAWSEQRYVDEWRKALHLALSGRQAALITDMRTPSQSSHLVWWPVWKVGDEIIFQNQLLFFAKHGLTGTGMEIDQLYGLIGKHDSKNKQGVPVSEWSVSLNDVEAFLKSDGADGLLASRSQSKRLH